MDFLRRQQQAGVVAYSGAWAEDYTSPNTFAQDEFEISAIDIVQAFLRRFESFSHGQSDTATKWARLIAIKEFVEQTRQTQFGHKDFELLVFVGVAGIGNNVITQLEYFTKSIAPPVFSPQPSVSSGLFPHEAIDAVIVDVALPPTPVVAGLSSDHDAAEFTPSDALIEIWVQSVTTWAREARGAASDRLVASYRRDNLASEFTRTLTDALGALAQKIRYGNSSADISHNGVFTARVQNELCDAFLILPLLSSDFLSLLHHELVDAVRNGWELSGAWGRLQITEAGELRFELEPPEFVRDPNFVRVG